MFGILAINLLRQIAILSATAQGEKRRDWYTDLPERVRRCLISAAEYCVHMFLRRLVINSIAVLMGEKQMLRKIDTDWTIGQKLTGQRKDRICMLSDTHSWPIASGCQR